MKNMILTLQLQFYVRTSKLKELENRKICKALIKRNNYSDFKNLGISFDSID